MPCSASRLPSVIKVRLSSHSLTLGSACRQLCSEAAFMHFLCNCRSARRAAHVAPLCRPGLCPAWSPLNRSDWKASIWPRLARPALMRARAARWAGAWRAWTACTATRAATCQRSSARSARTGRPPRPSCCGLCGPWPAALRVPVCQSARGLPGCCLTGPVDSCQAFVKVSSAWRPALLTCMPPCAHSGGRMHHE